MGSGRRQGAEEPPQEGGRGEGAACRRAAQQAGVQLGSGAAGAKRQAMGTLRPRQHWVRRLGPEDRHWGRQAWKDGVPPACASCVL